MDFFRRADGRPSRLGILPGTFNPLTIAHMQLALAALPLVDEVVLVLPRLLPHKPYVGATFEQRVEMLQAAVAGDPSISIASVDRGLFWEIAEDCRAAYGDQTRLTFLCGRDAAERIAGWDYGHPDAFAGMLKTFDLLVAARSGEYQPPPQYSHGIRPLILPGEFDHVSASEVRHRISQGEAWEHLVPRGIRDQVRRIYP